MAAVSARSTCPPSPTCGTGTASSSPVQPPSGPDEDGGAPCARAVAVGPLRPGPRRAGRRRSARRPRRPPRAARAGGSASQPPGRRPRQPLDGRPPWRRPSARRTGRPGTGRMRSTPELGELLHHQLRLVALHQGEADADRRARARADVDRAGRARARRREPGRPPAPGAVADGERLAALGAGARGRGGGGRRRRAPGASRSATNTNGPRPVGRAAPTGLLERGAEPATGSRCRPARPRRRAARQLAQQRPPAPA